MKSNSISCVSHIGRISEKYNWLLQMKAIANNKELLFFILTRRLWVHGKLLHTWVIHPDHSERLFYVGRWQPKRDAKTTLTEIYEWINQFESQVSEVFL